MTDSKEERLPWWYRRQESICQCSEHRFDPWSRKIPHVTEQLSPWATTTEPAHLEPVLFNKRNHHHEKPAHCTRELPPPASTRQSPYTATQTQCNQQWRNPVIQDARGWCTGMTQRDGMGKEVGGGFRMGNTRTPVADSCWCMTKPIQYCKVSSL